MVAAPNREFICAADDEAALAAALDRLAADPKLRRTVGEANRQRALAHYDEAAMVAAYRQVYGRVLGRGAFP